MTSDLAVMVGLLCAVGAWLVWQRSIARVLLGLVLLSNGINLLVLAAGRLPGARTEPLLVPGNAGPYVDPLPHALILTAIVIGFGVVAFGAFLLLRLHEEGALARPEAKSAERKEDDEWTS